MLLMQSTDLHDGSLAVEGRTLNGFNLRMQRLQVRIFQIERSESTRHLKGSASAESPKKSKGKRKGLTGPKGKGASKPEGKKRRFKIQSKESIKIQIKWKRNVRREGGRGNHGPSNEGNSYASHRPSNRRYSESTSVEANDGRDDDSNKRADKLPNL
jgi:hypothetical protein